VLDNTIIYIGCYMRYSINGYRLAPPEALYHVSCRLMVLAPFAALICEEGEPVDPLPTN